MPSEKLLLTHKELLWGRLKNVRSFLSEYSFANVYLFRETHDSRVLVEGGETFITGKTYDGKRYVMPTVRPQAQALGSLQDIAREYDFIFPVDEEWLGQFDQNKVALEVFDGDSDYIISVDKLSTYSGHKYHGKKNLLNQFLSLYTPRAMPLTRERMADALNILDAWQEDVGGPKNETDYDPCREAFELFDELILCGGIYYFWHGTFWRRSLLCVFHCFPNGV